MCLHTLTALRCGHYETVRLDGKGCVYYATGTLGTPTLCPDYKQVISREDRGRSCPRCKAVGLAGLGVGSFSLRSVIARNEAAIKDAKMKVKSVQVREGMEIKGQVGVNKRSGFGYSVEAVKG